MAELYRPPAQHYLATLCGNGNGNGNGNGGGQTMSAFLQTLALLGSDAAPALPVAWAMRLGLTLGWALVLAASGAALAYRLPLAARRALAVALVLWALVPGSASPDYWLGLAFHAPSLSAMLVLLWLLRRLLFPLPTGLRMRGVATPRGSLWWLVGAMLLGYALLLDAFAVLPLHVYAWGFSPVLLVALLLLSLLPWVAGGKAPCPWGWVAPCALVLFAATRLPTGNLWDALLDPWLWLALHIALLRALYRRWRGD
jgi:hypothetical protein